MDLLLQIFYIFVLIKLTFADFNNLSYLLNYDFISQGSTNEYLVRKIDSKYRLHTENALIQYLNSQLDDRLAHEYHMINARNLITQYNFTLSIEIMIRSQKLVDSLTTDTEIKELFDSYFLKSFIELFKLGQYIQKRVIELKKSRNLVITICLGFKETNIEILNTRLKYLLIILKNTLFTLDGLKQLKIFELADGEEDSMIDIKRVEFTSTTEEAFCMGINRLELERIIYPFEKLINNNLIIEKGNFLLRLNAYNKLLSISSTEGMIYQYKILFDENSFKADNEVDIKLCQDSLTTLDYDYGSGNMENDKIFFESLSTLHCNSTTSDLFYINDRHVLIGLHMKKHVLYFTPYEQNGTFLSINCMNCQQIGYRTYLVCLRKSDSLIYEKMFLELNNEVIRFLNYVKENRFSNGANLFEKKSIFYLLFSYLLKNLWH